MYISMRKLTEIFDNGYFSLSLIFIVGAGALSVGMMFGCVGVYVDERPKVKVRVKLLYFAAAGGAVRYVSEYLINYYV